MNFWAVNTFPVPTEWQNVNNMRAQVSIELLTTFGIILVFTVPVLLLLLTITQYGHENASMMQADATGRMLAHNIEVIYFQGDGAKKTLLLNFPSNTKTMTINESTHEIVLNISTSSGYYEAALPFYGNISQDVSESDLTGLLTFELENKNGVVEIQRV